MSLHTWVNDWAELPLEPLGWMHSGISVADGLIVVAHPGEPTLLFYDADVLCNAPWRCRDCSNRTGSLS